MNTMLPIKFANKIGPWAYMCHHSNPYRTLYTFTKPRIILITEGQDIPYFLSREGGIITHDPKTDK